jgi:hypothetical protein
MHFFNHQPLGRHPTGFDVLDGYLVQLGLPIELHERCNPGRISPLGAFAGEFVTLRHRIESLPGATGRLSASGTLCLGEC